MDFPKSDIMIFKALFSASEIGGKGSNLLLCSLEYGRAAKGMGAYVS